MLEPVTGKLTTRLMIVSNELPKLGDASGALSSRMLLLPLATSFYGREDRGLTAKLLKELPSILLWAIAGWKRLTDRGYFIQPDAGKELLGEPFVANYRERHAAFFREFFVFASDLKGELRDPQWHKRAGY